MRPREMPLTGVCGSAEAEVHQPVRRAGGNFCNGNLMKTEHFHPNPEATKRGALGQALSWERGKRWQRWFPFLAAMVLSHSSLTNGSCCLGDCRAVVCEHRKL
ncbi:hypothetical protein ZHAS_00021713 [Anopheles sinensis]|uniref:Uncharacterized protein n=1 Tax=Anopheles sinensis TaxID=74873 RepID=A0A084WT52_ANOSI|nr:hypothetical protein ZHAS_00021713 [Anopheles sinensis]